METGRATAIPGELLERLTERVDGAERDIARDFAEAVLRRAPAEQIETADPDALAVELAEGLRTIRRRSPGEITVRTFDLETAVDDWRDPGTIVEICADDRPFIVASLREELERLGYESVRTFHPIIGVERDDDGRLRRITSARGAEHRESLIHIELDQRLDERSQDDLREALRAVLHRVVLATDDYGAMTQRVERLVTELRGHAAAGTDGEDAEEAAAFLDWILDDNFILIGMRDYALVDHDGTPVVTVEEDSVLGVLLDEPSSYEGGVPLDEADDAMRERFAADRFVTVNRSHRYSAIRQRTRLLNIWVKRIDDNGRPIGQFRLVGLFSRRAHAVAASTVPILRRKLERILEREDVVEQSYDERALIALFHAIPLDELFELEMDELQRTIVGLFGAEERREVGIFRSVDQASGNVSIIVSVPRDRYDPAFRRRVQDLLRDRYGTEGVDVDISLGERPEAIARFSLHLEPGRIPDVALTELREEIRRLARTWLDALEASLAAANGDEAGRRLTAAYGQRLPVTYREHTPVIHAVDDVAALADMVDRDEPLAIRFHDDPRDEQRLTRLKILRAGQSIVLSQILPILESLGLTVAEELPFRLQETDDHEAPLYIHDYGVHRDGDLLDIEEDADRLAAAIEAAWEGHLEIDSLNRLVLHAGVAPDDVTLLRALRRFRRQIGTAYTADYQNDALVRNPATTRALLDHFATRFDPQGEGDDEAVAASRDRVVGTLDEVVRLDEDRILRDFLALIDATLRTNRYRDPRPGHLALKIRSGDVPGVPKPTPHVEVFVYSPEIEGIHLRGAPVSRGGIRWSDRRDDYRSEVLDLMQAQMLKNSLIVPDGAKGAFVIKPTQGRPTPSAPEAYEVYIRALLEVTDNVVGGDVVPPPGVRRTDGDDPYLVVAADRGTATFSDLANSIAEEHDHWLGDAFASGGSRGYDHKGLGITARGAWVAVERHFRELGIDIATEPFTVVGIGDMSGDVFGNAMLRSRATELVAAFDHRDIFLDPDPDPERSFEERRRLFEEPGSTWQDYDRDLISPGGGVWSRDEKSIPLSDEVRELLRVDDDALSPPELIRAVLAAPVDLLFAGGIGTYVKAYEESEEDVGDRTNAELRLNGADLRARVVGEGANLAFTQRGRIEYARRGGRINTDFIDNVAGVDISDHEVNLKILLRLAIEEDVLDADERDDLLREVSDAVVADCLEDVERQTWTLYQEAAASPTNMGSLETLISQLERREVLDREVEHLPDSDEMAERREAGAGLTRPELAVVLAATKRDISGLLLASEVPEREELRPLLEDYFPEHLLARCGDLLDRHRLRRELVATELSNEIVDRMGVRFVDELARELGVDPAPIAGAWWISQAVVDAPRHWATIDRLDREVDPELALEAKQELDEVLRTLTREYVRSWPPDDLRRRIAEDRAACEHLEVLIASRVTPHRSVTQRAERLVDAGVEPHDAALLASVRGVAIAPDVAMVAERTGVEATGVATAFITLDEALGLARLRRLVDRIEPHDRWSDWQRSGLADDLRAIHRTAAERALTAHPDVGEQEAVDHFVGQRSAAVRHALALARHLEQEPDERRLDAVSVAVRAVRDAISGD